MTLIQPCHEISLSLLPLFPPYTLTIIHVIGLVTDDYWVLWINYSPRSSWYSGGYLRILYLLFFAFQILWWELTSADSLYAVCRSYNAAWFFFLCVHLFGWIPIYQYQEDGVLFQKFFVFGLLNLFTLFNAGNYRISGGSHFTIFLCGKP